MKIFFIVEDGAASRCFPKGRKQEEALHPLPLTEGSKKLLRTLSLEALSGLAKLLESGQQLVPRPPGHLASEGNVH